MMKKMLTTVLLLILLVFIAIPTPVFALNTGLMTEELSETDNSYFLENEKFVLLTEEPERQRVQLFDISQNGTIALGYEDFNSKTVTVYSKDGEFQYGYAFTTYGDFGIEWNAENLNIYFVRSDILATVDPLGRVIETARVLTTPENNTYIRSNFYSRKKNIDGQTYQLKNDGKLQTIFANSYSQLTTTANGDERVLYCALTTASDGKNAILLCVFVGLALSVCLGTCKLIIFLKKTRMRG